MTGKDPAELLLGKQTPVVDKYAPQLLFPIPRADGRSRIDLGEALPFSGVDVWHAYEMSWLDPKGKPVCKVGRFSIPADSPNMVESKSFKLYLNSLNSTSFQSPSEARRVMEEDLSKVLGVTPAIELLAVDDSALAGIPLQGTHLDHVTPDTIADEPSVDLLSTAGSDLIEETLYTHLLRSLCPVTGQPDWASVWLKYRGRAVTHSSLLGYFISFRKHQEYHEQCVERMFRDIAETTEAEHLQIQACYTRRGGLDINPFRCTDPGAKPLSRLNRQ
ncbi:MAG: NADPH-dependent 7-cyano-7-deazaguanine reductase QueF [Pseudomonadota bacterium]